MKQKLLYVSMTLIMLCISINVKAAYSGTCGDNLRWSFYNGILSISGNGRMTDWDISEDVPWYSNRSNIRQVIINNSVTSIGALAFFDCLKLASVIIPNSVTNIGTAAFSGCTDLTSITIPNSVTNIGNSAFSTCKGLTSLTIPNSVTSIGEAAFIDCTNLTSITIPNSVTSIGGRAFSRCKGLASITIPNSVTSIGEEAFQNCSSLTSVTIPNSVTSMGHGVFSGCYSITSIKVESGNSNYDSRENCNAIIETTTNTLISGCQKTIIPNSVTSIGNDAFLFCSTLTSITIPNSVTSIGEYAFYGCTGLTSVTIPYSVTSIGGCAFYGCKGLTSITIPYSVTSIGNNAFFNCSGLTSVTIPNTMTSIGQYAFLGCDGLTSVICEALNPPTIFFETFMSSTYTNASLKVYESSLNAYKQDNYWKNFTKIEAMSSPIFVSNITLSATSASLKVGETKTLTATISPTDASYKNVKWTSSNENVATVSASGVVTAKVVGSTTITATATDGSGKKATCSVTVTNIIANGTCGDSLTWELSIDGTLTISGSGRMKDWNSFTAVPWDSNSSQINKVIIGNSVTSIGSCAFYGCSKLTSVTIPNSVTSIGGLAFRVCSSLTSIEIPNSVTNIEIGVFSSCSNLKSINVESGNSKYDSRNNCNAIIETTTNTLISGCQNTIIPNTVTSIGNFAFEGCSRLTSITIPNSVTSIEEYAFYGCKGLKSITIPNSVVSLGNNAFKYSSSLTSVIIPNSVTSIGKEAFQSCSALTSITIPNSVTSIGSSTFYNCSKLTSVTIGNSVTSIEEYAFYGCKGLTSITIPNSVTSIGNYAFKNCSGLTSITIPDSVISLGNYTFSGCSNLSSIKVEAGNSKYDSRENCNAIVETATNILMLGCNNTIIPNSVTIIRFDAFDGCSGLTAITIPNSVTSIANGAFSSCSGLVSITCEATIPPKISSGTFSSSIYTKATLKVYNSSIDAYRQADYWKNFSKIETISSSISVTGITLNATSASLKVGETKTLTATVSPTDASNKNITWSSSNENVATVNTSGVVTAKAAGSATITATTADGSDKKATCTIQVISDIKLGDVTRDGVINVGDLTALITMVMDSYAVKDDKFAAADMNTDGVLNVGDITALVTMIMNENSQVEYIIFEDDFNWVPFTGITDQCAYNSTGETRADKAAFKDHADNQGWTSKTTWAYTRPGYMKLGKSSYGGDLCSPALAKIEGTQKVTLTFQAVVYCSKTGIMDPGVLHVAVLNAGTITKISGGMKTNHTDAIHAYYAVAAYPEITSAATIKLDPENPSGTEPGNEANIGDVNSNPADCWNNEVSKYTIEIEGATSATQILFVGGTYNAGPTDRPCIDNVKVIKTPAPTAVQSVINESAKKEIYTLDGVRVNSNNLERGIYIVNGKKVWMK